jgi:hypothetical protein
MLNVINGVVLLPKGDDPISNEIPLGCGTGTPGRFLEKLAPRVLAKLMTQDAETSIAIAEALGGFVRRQVLDEKSAQSFVLAMGRAGRLQEDLREIC